MMLFPSIFEIPLCFYLMFDQSNLTLSNTESNIPSSPAYGVYMSQLIRYSKTCNSYQNFIHRSVLLTRKLLNQGFIET